MWENKPNDMYPNWKWAEYYWLDSGRRYQLHNKHLNMIKDLEKKPMRSSWLFRSTWAPHPIPRVFSGVRVARSLVLCVMLCWSLFDLFYPFLCWPLYCLSFCDLRLLITPFVVHYLISNTLLIFSWDTYHSVYFLTFFERQTCIFFIIVLCLGVCEGTIALVSLFPVDQKYEPNDTRNS
jgi:hypothetical protein